MTCAYGSINGAEPCGEPSTHAFTWPGQPRSQLCAKHLHKLCMSSLPHLLAIEPLGPEAVTLPEPIADAFERAVLEGADDDKPARARR